LAADLVCIDGLEAIESEGRAPAVAQQSFQNAVVPRPNPYNGIE